MVSVLLSIAKQVACVVMYYGSQAVSQAVPAPDTTSRTEKKGSLCPMKSLAYIIHTKLSVTPFELSEVCFVKQAKMTNACKKTSARCSSDAIKSIVGRQSPSQGMVRCEGCSHCLRAQSIPPRRPCFTKRLYSLLASLLV